MSARLPFFPWSIFTINRDVPPPEFCCPNCKWEGMKDKMLVHLEIPMGDNTIQKLSCPKCHFMSGLSRMKNEYEEAKKGILIDDLDDDDWEFDEDP